MVSTMRLVKLDTIVSRLTLLKMRFPIYLINPAQSLKPSRKILNSEITTRDNSQTSYLKILSLIAKKLMPQLTKSVKIRKTRKVKAMRSMTTSKFLQTMMKVSQVISISRTESTKSNKKRSKRRNKRNAPKAMNRRVSKMNPLAKRISRRDSNFLQVMKSTLPLDQMTNATNLTRTRKYRTCMTEIRDI